MFPMSTMCWKLKSSGVLLSWKKNNCVFNDDCFNICLPLYCQTGKEQLNSFLFRSKNCPRKRVSLSSWNSSVKERGDKWIWPLITHIVVYQRAFHVYRFPTIAAKQRRKLVLRCTRDRVSVRYSRFARIKARFARICKNTYIDRKSANYPRY